MQARSSPEPVLPGVYAPAPGFYPTLYQTLRKWYREAGWARAGWQPEVSGPQFQVHLVSSQGGQGSVVLVSQGSHAPSPPAGPQLPGLQRAQLPAARAQETHRPGPGTRLVPFGGGGLSEGKAVRLPGGTGAAVCALLGEGVEGPGASGLWWAQGLQSPSSEKRVAVVAWTEEESFQSRGSRAQRMPGWRDSDVIRRRPLPWGLTLPPPLLFSVAGKSPELSPPAFQPAPQPRGGGPRAAMASDLCYAATGRLVGGRGGWPNCGPTVARRWPGPRAAPEREKEEGPPGEA